MVTASAVFPPDALLEILWPKTLHNLFVCNTVKNIAVAEMQQQRPCAIPTEQFLNVRNFPKKECSYKEKVYVFFYQFLNAVS